MVVRAGTLSRLASVYATRKVLMRYLRRRPACATSDRVFLQSNLKPIMQVTIKQLFKKLKRKTEIPRLHPHLLRHTFATRCFEKKMEPKVVQRLMGHSSISITLNIYTHVLDNIMEEEIKKFGVAKTQTPEEYYNEEI